MFGRRALDWINLYFKLTLVGGIRVLAVLGTADLFGDTLDAGNRGEPCGYAPAKTRRFRQRDAGAQ